MGHKVKTSESFVNAVAPEEISELEENHGPQIEEGLGELASRDSSLFGLLFTLLAVKTLPHIIALTVASILLYSIAAGSEGLAAVGFTSLAIGYATTALLSNNDGIRSWTHLAPWEGERPPLLKRTLLSTRILIVPFSVAAVFGLCFLMLTNDAAVDALAVVLASLFVFWAVAQGRSFSAWAASVAAKNLPAMGEKTGNGYVGLTMIGTLVTLLGAAGVMAYALLHSTNPLSKVNIGYVLLFTGLSLGVFVLMKGLTWKYRNTAMKDKALRRFHFRWSLLAHLFVTWHLLTVFRHIVMEPSELEVYVEEIALMILTVFMGIWTLTSRGVGSELKLLNNNNALPWGLAFGYAYAGSVAVINSFLGENLLLVMVLGHLIAAMTGVLMHRSILRKLLEQRVNELEIQRIMTVANLHPVDEDGRRKTMDTVHLEEPENEQEDWRSELDNDWEKQQDVGLKAEVEWEEVITIED